MYQWRGEDWTARVCTPFAAENFLHSAEFVWKSCEPTAAQEEKGKGKGKERGGAGSNPGETDRQKRAYRSFRTRMEKRYWVTNTDRAEVLGGFWVGGVRG